MFHQVELTNNSSLLNVDTESRKQESRNLAMLMSDSRVTGLPQVRPQGSKLVLRIPRSDTSLRIYARLFL
jgi:hypothetical protein